MALVPLDIHHIGLARLAHDLAVFGKRLPNAQALVLNRMVTRARPKVVDAVVEQTGLAKRIIVKAIVPLRASSKNLRAGLVSRGGEISYRFFRAREEGSGVVATVAGRRVFIAGGFRRSGRAPNRYMVKRLGGQVYVNPSRRWRGEIEKQRSGVWIPEEMARGASREAFDDVVANDLPAEVARELGKLGAKR
ncbi:hypothetical protein [Hansschlegelia zhihuaiae]|uniref:HK97 gp10 family phage protein n=1 Tax=Hansschlegelia zhihuaiae TaxID=405005 RepID=A0A4Q0M4C9_9HYPH|nr:hypothetical protein [Hansschlegelia zhihuaiae]RXF67683.1 hypothetical protein EK403_21000 [Hansschlegelia zhihuaiae]